MKQFWKYLKNKFYEIFKKEKFTNLDTSLPLEFEDTFIERKVRIIDGIVEMEDENGFYKGRICEDALEAHVYMYDIIVLKTNGDLLRYCDLGDFYGKILDDVLSAKIIEGEIWVTKKNGEKGTCDFNGVYLREN